LDGRQRHPCFGGNNRWLWERRGGYFGANEALQKNIRVHQPLLHRSIAQDRGSQDRDSKSPSNDHRFLLLCRQQPLAERLCVRALTLGTAETRKFLEFGRLQNCVECLGCRES
jgi:hypothetical protein